MERNIGGVTSTAEPLSSEGYNLVPMGMDRALDSEPDFHPDSYYGIASAVEEGRKLEPETYRPQDLSKLVADNMEISILRQLTEQEQGFLFSLEEDVGNEDKDEILTLLRTAFPILDKACFFSSLGDHINSIETFSGEEVSVGDVQHTGIHAIYDHSNRIIHVSHDTHRFNQIRASHKQQLITILIHEMLHAFFDIYMCRCSFCFSEVEQIKTLGTSGHGPCWCDAMSAIARAVLRDLDWNTNFVIAESVQVEVMDGFEPTDEQLIKWRLCRQYGENGIKIRELWASS